MQEHEKLFREFLKTKNLKLTRPRKIILDTIFSYHRHFNVEGLYEVIYQDHKNVSRATIYRTMPLLLDSGLIKQSLRCQSKDHYEHIHGHADHLHLLCVKCGAIIEVDSKDVEKIVKRLAMENNFTINTFNLGAKGICSRCRKKMES